MRLPEGMHRAVKEIAEHVGVDISDMAAFILGVGLESMKYEFTEDTQAIIQADALEAQAAILRAYVATGKGRGSKEWKQFEEAMGRLAKLIKSTSGEG